jgi:hypothetical protein
VRRYVPGAGRPSCRAAVQQYRRPRLPLRQPDRPIHGGIDDQRVKPSRSPTNYPAASAVATVTALMNGSSARLDSMQFVEPWSISTTWATGRVLSLATEASLAGRQGFVLAACRLRPSMLAAQLAAASSSQVATGFPSFLGGGNVIQSKRSWLDAPLHQRLVSIAPAVRSLRLPDAIHEHARRSNENDSACRIREHHFPIWLVSSLAAGHLTSTAGEPAARRPYACACAGHQYGIMESLFRLPILLHVLIFSSE